MTGVQTCALPILLVGAGRMRLRRALEKRRDDGDRTLHHDDYLALCAEVKDVSSPEHALTFLHNCGVVFYQHGLFDDQIILDQGWALEAIYAVFNRDKCLRRLRRQRGRFTQADLAELVWDEAGHGEGEQRLFLDMMVSCGVCFALRETQYDRKRETEYVAPDLLPETRGEEIAQKWDASGETFSRAFTYDLLPPGLMRAIISRIGREAGFAGDYWQNGVYVYEKTTGARALIVQTRGAEWSGTITLSTQRGQAGELLERLGELIAEEERKMGVMREEVSAPKRRGSEGGEADEGEKRKNDAEAESHREMLSAAPRRGNTATARSGRYVLGHAPSAGPSPPDGRSPNQRRRVRDRHHQI